ncbi:MAG: methylmalonyl Co-A mutase-associated GTPase MeaB, partial [Paracoccaceae bacterium]|nr:methylmalonyl Co-A mutase-associated GTPase MeaB [Paracoccaceae bacterium]
LEDHGLDVAWNEMKNLVDWRKENGHFNDRRAEQQRFWFEEEVRQTLLAQLELGPVKARMSEHGDLVAAGGVTASKAAADILKMLKD